MGRPPRLIGCRSGSPLGVGGRREVTSGSVAAEGGGARDPWVRAAGVHWLHDIRGRGRLGEVADGLLNGGQRAEGQTLGALAANELAEFGRLGVSVARMRGRAQAAWTPRAGRPALLPAARKHRRPHVLNQRKHPLELEAYSHQPTSFLNPLRRM